MSVGGATVRQKKNEMHPLPSEKKRLLRDMPKQHNLTYLNYKTKAIKLMVSALMKGLFQFNSLRNADHEILFQKSLKQ